MQACLHHAKMFCCKNWLGAIMWHISGSTHISEIHYRICTQQTMAGTKSVWFTGSQMPNVLSETMEPEDVRDRDEDEDDDDDADNDCFTDDDSDDDNRDDD